LQHRERGILDLIHGEEIAARLLRSATVSGYRSLGMEGGSLAVGEPADFFTLDMNDLAILGVDRESLASQVVFAAGRSAIRDVAVSGRMVMRDGVHPLGNVIRESCRDVQRRFASDSKII
jgi:formimidoylglutamate deiminase